MEFHLAPFVWISIVYWAQVKIGSVDFAGADSLISLDVKNRFYSFNYLGACACICAKLIWSDRPNFAQKSISGAYFADIHINLRSHRKRDVQV